jgi:uncharacterized protein YceH (UPF0502 family)
MAEAERYGHNVVASQVDDPLTQEAFRDQERINAELKSKIDILTVQVSALRAMVAEQAETLALLMD